MMDMAGSTRNFSSVGFSKGEGGGKQALQLKVMMGKEVQSSQDRGESLKQLRARECLERRTRACQAVMRMFGCFSQALVNAQVSR